MKYNTRIAPSPTGDMHLGTLRTAYFNWLVARSTGGQFILRIDDTDQDRNITSKIQDIYSIMEWANLNYDKTFKQSDNIDIYRGALNALIAKDLAFQKDGAYYLKYTDELNMPSFWVDEIAGEIVLTEEDYFRIKGNKLGENGLVLWTSKDRPTYHFACVVDDMIDNINYIIRGKDHISNTPKQIAIYLALCLALNKSIQIPKYAHLGLLTLNKRKLSKRDNAASCLQLKEAGFESKPVLNFLLKMGWGPHQDDKTTVLIDQYRALDMFLSKGKMRNADSNVDLNILKSLTKKWKNIVKDNDSEWQDPWMTKLNKLL